MVTGLLDRIRILTIISLLELTVTLREVLLQLDQEVFLHRDHLLVSQEATLHLEDHLLASQEVTLHRDHLLVSQEATLHLEDHLLARVLQGLLLADLQEEEVSNTGST